MLDYVAIGKRIRMYRKKRGLSQESLAEKVWISTTHMSHIETGNTKLSLAVLADLSAALEVSTDKILFGKDDEKDLYDWTEINRIMGGCSQKQLSILCELVENFKKNV